MSLADRLSGRAKDEYEAARLLFGDHDYAGALVKFRSAYDQSKEPRLLFDMGACEKNLRHYARTIADFEQYRAEAAQSLSAAEIEEVDRYLAELRPFVGRLSIDSSEPLSRVYIDDELVGTTPLGTAESVDIGERKVRVTKKGFLDFATTVAITGQGETVVHANLQKVVHEGRLVVRAGPKDAIDLDGELKALGQLDASLSSGGHQLRVTAKGMQPFQTEVVILDGQARTVDVTLQPQPGGGVPAWAWVVGATLLAGGAAVGGYYLLKPKDEPGSPTSGSISPGLVTLSLRR